MPGGGAGLRTAGERAEHHGQGALPVGLGEVQGDAPGALPAAGEGPRGGELQRLAQGQGALPLLMRIHAVHPLSLSLVIYV